MFQLPQPLDAHNHPILPLTEDSGTLDKLFRICYPVPDPQLDNLEDVGAVLAAGVKYDMEGVQAVCTKALLDPDLGQEDPVGVYAVAVNLKLLDEACAAAGQTLRYPHEVLTPPSSTLASLPATAYVYLLQYRERCRLAALKAVDAFSDSLYQTSELYEYDCHECEDPTQVRIPHWNHPRRWFVLDQNDYLSYTVELLEATPSGDALLEDAELGLCRFVKSLLPACKNCRRRIRNAMQYWRKYFAEEVNKAVAKQRLQITF
ncbi:hypothetical protein SCP_0601340 [Sparassis crispa]|uniref:BTB domain-containing protein n=1 Tax=Sparassis crispa TaxID=139825 RepID=A0A401GPL2_9APHY|nr:hypothetical protein SCP_0601340 [Sparassis crispa]GBE84156.1 hypothetical protein SCP_0601340 [Sparassis crispa]